MKTRLTHLFFISLLFCSLVFLTGCTMSKGPGPPKKPKFKTSKNLCDTIKTQITENLNSVAFINPHVGIAVGNNGTIIFTKNAGYSWTTVSPITSANLYGLAMVDPFIVIAVGEKGTILRSTDTGLTWDTVLSENVDFMQSLRTVAFYTRLNGYAAGDSGVVFSTRDAGANWKKVHENPTQAYYGLSYNSYGTPFIVGNNGTVLRDSAFTETVVTTKDLKSIHFALDSTYFTHSNTGCIVGDGGVILMTTNGGNNWSDVSSPTSENLRSVFLTSSHWGYAVGENGTVLRYNGKKWKSLSKATAKTLNAVDPVWEVTSTCVGEDGEILNYYPDPVTNGSYITPNTTDCGSWTFDLHIENFDDSDPFGNLITYELLSISSNVEIDRVGSGWAMNDNFHGESEPLVDLIPNPPGDHTIGDFSTNYPAGEYAYVTCCLRDTGGNLWLLNSFTCPAP